MLRSVDDVEDRELLLAWRNGDRGAGSLLFQRHFGRVYRFFDAKLDCDVDELTQRTFVGCIESQDRLDGLRSFKAYLFGIARLQLMQWLRERRRADRHVPLPELVAEGSPSQRLDLEERGQVVLGLLRQIPNDLQIALQLFYWERLSVAEIAVVLGIPAGTVKSRLHRAKGLLRAGGS
jgi:RNA polymerase sigma-70 factor (ECF subfamily)